MRNNEVGNVSDAWLKQLRDLMPPRTLRVPEAQRIAEWQAIRLRQLLNVNDPVLPTSAITTLPQLTVTSRPSLPRSALLTPTERGWVIVLNDDEPLVRRRFSLAHEIKHLIDDAAMADRCGRLYSPADASTIERVCDYFAACLLIPKPALRRDWCEGIQSTDRLARHYQVSPRAMERRLAQIGLATKLPIYT